MIGSLVDARVVPTRRMPKVGSIIKVAIADAVKAWRIANAQRRIAVELGALSDHILKDIGVPRDLVYLVAPELTVANGQDRQA